MFIAITRCKQIMHQKLFVIVLIMKTLILLYMVCCIQVLYVSGIVQLVGNLTDDLRQS